MRSLLIFLMCTPHPQKRHFHALPLIALPSLENHLHINHNSFISFKLYILFLFQTQTRSEEVRWVKVLCCLNWVNPWPVPHWKPFFVYCTHTHSTLFVTVDVDWSVGGFASNCLIMSKVHQADQFVCVCGGGEGGRGGQGVARTPPHHPL